MLRMSVQYLLLLYFYSHLYVHTKNEAFKVFATALVHAASFLHARLLGRLTPKFDLTIRILLADRHPAFSKFLYTPLRVRQKPRNAFVKCVESVDAIRPTVEPAFFIRLGFMHRVYALFRQCFLQSPSRYDHL